MAENVVINDTTYNGVDTLALLRPDGSVVTFYPDAVRYNAQNLTEAQKEQARKNIGAVSEIDIPVKGVDYWTSADQEEIVQQTLIALGKPIVGEVDANKNIKLVGTLAKGVYSVKYESDDGSLVDVGQIEIGGISYTNLVPTAEALESTAPYNGVGYKNGYYVSSSTPYEGVDATTVLTGYMPYTIPATGLPGTIYVSGAQVQTVSHCRVYFFNDIKTMTGSGVQGSQLSTYFTIETLSNGVTKLTPIASGDKSKLLADSKGNTNAKYFRMSLVGTGENLIITVNEPIE